jgi:tyrosyl-tRNA synthetase
MSTALEQQVEVLMSNTGYGDEGTANMMRRELHERLAKAEKEGRPLRVYCGYDPRTSDLHLGHTITIRKLRQFQDFGHQVIFLIGSFTSLIGDPDDRNAREILTLEQVKRNAETYAEQAFKILDPARTEVRYNDEWLAPLNFLDIIKLAQSFTVQQFLARENFRHRLDEGTPIYLHEFFYPLMQGYDPIGLKADVQVGGQDQLFNLMAGRQLMSKMGLPPQIIVVMGESLPGTDGLLKMSKSKGNHIPLLTDALDMFGKVMSIPDSAMPLYYKLLLTWTQGQLDSLAQLHPREAKAQLARDIVAIFHPTSDPQAVQAEWERIFKSDGIPDNVVDFPAQDGARVVDILAAAGLCASKSEARRQIEGGGVRLDGEKVANPEASVSASAFPQILQVGKRKFIRLVQG